MRARAIRQRRILLASSLLILIAAWLYGYYASGSEVLENLDNVLPAATRFERRGLPAATRFERRGEIFVGYADNPGSGEIVGYAMVGSATGYGGPVDVLVSIDPAGEITGIQILEHKETPGFFRLLPLRAYFHQFLGRDAQSHFQIGVDIDGVSGATLSAEAVAMSIRQAVRHMATEGLNQSVPTLKTPIKFGVPEVTLILLYAVGYFFHRSHNPRLKKWVRWASLLTGLVVLGFIYNKPLSIANVTSFLAGYWPNWRINLYWYLLLVGILLVVTAQGKNPYCTWFCPFGAFQEILASFTGARVYRPRKVYPALQWLARGLAFTAIVLGLVFRNPGAASYEPFSALFDFNAAWPQWVLLGLVLLASLLIYRPFCTYLCPLHPVVDGIEELRRWIRESWHKIRPAQRPSNKAS